MIMIFKPLSTIGIITVCLIIFNVSCINQSSRKSSEILWDNWGVPHVYANNEVEMYYAFGWSQMHNHANLMLKLYAQARGKAAEYIDKEYLNLDKQIHLFNLPDSAEAHYARAEGKSKQYLDAFVKGINDYANANSDKIDEGMKQVLPVQATDILAHEKRVMCLSFLGGSDISNSIREITPGSNSYAIAPSKSASGNAMLVTNPHLPWSDLMLFFEAHLIAPEFNAYGVTLIGFSTLLIAFNEHLGWTHTVNTIDASDRYELTLQDDGYLLDDEIVSFQEKSIQLKVLQEDGTLKEKNIELRYSEHGPVIGDKGDKAYAVRIAGLGNDLFNVQYHKMAKAKNLNEFEDALKMLQNPMFNVIYADQDGNILYFFNGNVPVRGEGDWNFWNKTVDGTTSKYIWDRYHDYEDLPRLVNPPSGFVQNANDPPWTSTSPTKLAPKDYPPYMSPGNIPTHLRAQRAVNLVKDDSSIGFNQLVDYKLDTGMEAADRFLNDLLAAVEQFPDSIAVKAAKILQEWDRATNVDSRGAVLFAKWFDKLDGSMITTPWRLDKPFTTPVGLNNPKRVVENLVIAAKEVEATYGSMDIAWGEINRFKLGKYEFPGNGASHNYGVFRTMYFAADNESNKNYAYHGDTYVAVTEFGKSVKAVVLLSYGNATEPTSKHIGDQLEFLSEKKMRPALLTKKDVLQNIEKREELNINND